MWCVSLAGNGLACSQQYADAVRKGYTLCFFSLSQELTKTVPAGARIVLCCSGRGDKDVNAAMRYFDMATGEIRENLDQLT